MTYPLEEAIAAWRAGEVTQKELARATGASVHAISRLFKKEAGESYRLAVKCHEALLAIRAERAATPEKKEGSN